MKTLEERVSRLERLVKKYESDVSSVHRLITAFVDKFGIDLSDLSVEDNDALECIAEFYLSQGTSTDGKVMWMKRDFDTYKKTGTCRPMKIANQQPRQRRSWRNDGTSDNPSYRGPRGNWSLD